MSKGFTLMEVTLAMLIMAGGILSIVGLYSFGYRENRQSREDVASAAYADAVLSPLIMACSATNLKWSVFKDEFRYPSGNSGWGEYLNKSTGQVDGDPQSKAENAFSSLMSKMSGAAKGALNVDSSFPSAVGSSSGLRAALVVLHEENSAIVKLGFRATPKNSTGSLLAMPHYYTEVRFQGLSDESDE